MPGSCGSAGPLLGQEQRVGHANLLILHPTCVSPLPFNLIFLILHLSTSYLSTLPPVAAHLFSPSYMSLIHLPRNIFQKPSCYPFYLFPHPLPLSLTPHLCLLSTLTSFPVSLMPLSSFPFPLLSSRLQVPLPQSFLSPLISLNLIPFSSSLQPHPFLILPFPSNLSSLTSPLITVPHSHPRVHFTSSFCPSSIPLHPWPLSLSLHSSNHITLPSNLLQTSYPVT
jgi:hypothetical protein